MWYVILALHFSFLGRSNPQECSELCLPFEFFSLCPKYQSRQIYTRAETSTYDRCWIRLSVILSIKVKNSYQLAVASTGLVVSTRLNGASRYCEYRENHGAEKNKLRKLKFLKNRISEAALFLVSIMLRKFDPSRSRNYSVVLTKGSVTDSSKFSGQSHTCIPWGPVRHFTQWNIPHTCMKSSFVT